jgi:UDP-glucose 4-epimerase
VQTSLYGASKLAAEALLSAYAEGFGFQVWLLRLVSVLGERYSHGHVFDFYKKLRADPAEVEVLGDGRQRKSYVYVRDCVDALMTAVQRAEQPVSVLNVGVAEDCTVDDSLDWICAHLGLQPRRRYSGGARGWAGDSRRVLLDTSRLEGLGWCPRVGIREGVERTLRYLQAHPWLLERA